uniref:DUF3109 family protein n=1 Tax=uncultured bacterium pUR16A2 TaxID=1204710 RepID=R9QZW2_9BACT|nr:hypothetical protein [uncultured bacterium pUR16A2]
MKRDFGTIIEIGKCLVSEDVIFEYFSCDYEVCKGKCCIAGEYGAPLLEEELDRLEETYDSFSDQMSQRGRDAVEKKGFFEIDIENDLVTPVVPGTEECAYTHFDSDGNCLCAIEKCFLAGKCSFHKPISCRLYPIRVTKLTGGGLALNVHHWDICRDAFEKGKREDVRVYQFLRKPIEDYFGTDFYEALDAAAKALL